MELEGLRPKSPIVIREQFSRGSREDCGACSMPPSICLEVSPAVGEQLLHRATAMIARDVGVEVLPDALDAVRVGAVRREEMQDHAAIERLQRSMGRV